MLFTAIEQVSSHQAHRLMSLDCFELSFGVARCFSPSFANYYFDLSLLVLAIKAVFQTGFPSPRRIVLLC